MSTSNKGVFISFEGIDGCGKSTQVQMLLKRLEEEGIYPKRFAMYFSKPDLRAWIQERKHCL